MAINRKEKISIAELNFLISRLNEEQSRYLLLMLRSLNVEAAKKVECNSGVSLT